MAVDPNHYRNPNQAFGMPEDPKATDTASNWSMISLLKGIWDKLNGTITVTAPVGSATSALQTAEAVLIGAVTETAPATDTASSGLNGRLQRIAQRVTSLIALVPASLGAKTAASSFAVTVATDDPLVTRLGEVQASPTSNTVLDRLKALLTGIILAAGEAHVGEIGGNTLVVPVTPTVDTTPDYSSDDVMGGKQTIANAGRVSGGTGIVSSISISSKVAVSTAVRIVFFKADPSATTFTENSALALNAADYDKVLGHVDIAASDWADLGTNEIATKLNVNVPYDLTGTTSLFAVCLARSTINLASASDLTFNYGILRD